MASNTITVAYVDLSTYDEIEELLYAGASAANIFHARITKCIWFAQMPIKLRAATGTINFGNQFTFTQPRQGDYATYTWARVTLPELRLSAAAVAAGQRIAWADDIGLTLFQGQEGVQFTVNDIPLQRNGTLYLDHRSNHSVDESHWQNYQNMIGNRPSMQVPSALIIQQTIDVPLWAFYQKHGAAFPHSNIPYADVKWEFSLRQFSQLVKVQGASLSTVISNLSNTDPSITRFELWTNYVVLTQDMRSLMGAIPRQMLIDQVQETSAAMNLPDSGSTTGVETSVDLRFSYHLVWLTWVAQNLTRSTSLVGTGPTAGYQYTNYTDNVDGDGNVPIATTTILYESSERLNQMPADYYGWIVPFFHFERSPKKTGFQTWSLAYFGNSYNPTGGLNASRMFNMSARVVSLPGLKSNLPFGVTASMVQYKLLFNAQVKQIILFTGGGIVIEFH